jgi:HK97 family phage portal protein
VILDRNAKFLPTSLSGVDAQHLETRKYQIEEVCRAYRVMPIMVGYSDKASTYASAEQMFLAHVVHTLSPWYERIEQSANAKLLSPQERTSGLYTKFVAAGLLRGALKDTAEYLHKLVLDGIMTRNEARDKLDLNPLDGLNEPLTPANMNVGTEPPNSGEGNGSGA